MAKHKKQIFKYRKSSNILKKKLGKKLQRTNIYKSKALLFYLKINNQQKTKKNKQTRFKKIKYPSVIRQRYKSKLTKQYIVPLIYSV
jgi:hypothetical protein